MSDEPKKALVALSAGGDVNELADQGIGIEHVNELMVRFSMQLLRDGHRLSYGGTLGNPNEPLTQHVIDTALRWLDDEATEGADVGDRDTWPLVNYSGWPYFTFISPEERAKLVGICNFEDVPPENVSSEELQELLKEWKSKPVARRRNADSLSRMRRKSAEEASLRIVWGGKIRGASGWMAGILEEVACTLDLGKPMLLLGGFGGCAKLIADFLVEESARWPSDLNLESTSDSERDNLLSSKERKQLRDRFEKAKTDLEAYRSDLHGKKTLNGIESDRLMRALTETSPRQVIRLGADAAKTICSGGSK